MGVPITFLEKYNPNQFEIVKFRKGDDNKDLSLAYEDFDRLKRMGLLNKKSKSLYFRIIIRKRLLQNLSVSAEILPWSTLGAYLELVGRFCKRLEIN